MPWAEIYIILSCACSCYALLSGRVSVQGVLKCIADLRCLMKTQGLGKVISTIVSEPRQQQGAVQNVHIEKLVVNIYNVAPQPAGIYGAGQQCLPDSNVTEVTMRTAVPSHICGPDVSSSLSTMTLD